MVNRIVVGAHYGLKDWLAQRITAVIMAVYTVIFVVAALVEAPFTYLSWHAFMSQGWMRFVTFLFFIALAYHAWLGMRDIFMDYIKPTGIRLACHVVVLVLLIGYVGWAVQVLWRL